MNRMFSNTPNFFAAISLMLSFAFATSFVQASDFDEIGLTLLRATTTNLNGSGVTIAQVEAPVTDATPPPFEVNPAAVGIAPERFNYFVGPPTVSSNASSSVFPNSLGSESGHANVVGNLFYGIGGVSTSVAHIDNYEANYFFETVVPSQIEMTGRIVNQSFIAPGTVSEQIESDANYDHYAARFNTLFISGAGNSGTVNPPSTSYNGISVGAFGGSSSFGPTRDNGRAKPDMVAPAEVTSYSTALVSGAATLLLQAALRGDGGSDTNAAADIRTLKALLLNGAIKPVDWTNINSSPLDHRYGAGVINVFNSWKQLAGGRQHFIESTSVSSGNIHPPGNATENISVRSGWDFNAVSSSDSTDGINHYYFEIRNEFPSGNFTATATLVWNRQTDQSTINDLDLFLYETLSGKLIRASASAVDNVEHLYLPALPPGRYDLQVLKHSGGVSEIETYALAFEFFTLTLSIRQSESSVMLAWPVYPAGFHLQFTTNINDPFSWNAVDATPVLSNGQNEILLNTVSGHQFFRLIRP
ncbi:MAG TPA: S8 family serine peptidase [Verrucomicrobiae bacterium]|nr:S8 family serine peptidase [Verrucomicrobiae bacterium]